METFNLEEPVQPSQPAAAPQGRAQSSTAASTGEAQTGPDLELILDVQVEVIVELGRARMLVAELLQLHPGAVVELSKTAGEPVDLVVGGKVIARGEVVVVDENFGIRITDIQSAGAKEDE
jgi:flagellar motor switch protein FliN/FliY